MSFVVEAENFSCNFCQKSYTKESERNKHERRSHKIDLDKKSLSDKTKERGDVSHNASHAGKFKYGE